MSTKSDKVDAFHKLLNQHKHAPKSKDVSESLAKLRRMILVEGIPAKEASTVFRSLRNSP